MLALRGEAGVYVAVLVPIDILGSIDPMPTIYLRPIDFDSAIITGPNLS